MRSFGQSRRVPRLGAAGLLVGVSLALGACDKQLGGLDGLTTSSTQPPSLQETAAVGKRWQSDPGNVSLGIAYAGQLKALDQTRQGLDVYRTLAERNPADVKVQRIYGKELLQAGQAAEATPVLQRATQADPNDWRSFSALGSALDQQEHYQDARSSYAKALELSPGEPTVMNNLGMSYALEGDLKKAEETLRQASNTPKGKSEPRLRQNLALVIGLQGRFEEARKIASQDLPPDQVEANMAYLQTMLSQSNTWQKLKPAS